MDSSLTPVTKWLLVSLVALLWFVLLGYRDLAEPDEGRYAEVPREMVASGDWVTPRINGFKYFEKPAFQYWMTAAAFSLFGESNATARLWVALIAFLGGLWIMYVGGRLWGGEAGLYAFLVLLSGMLYALMGHFITLDMTVSVLLSLGLGSLLIAQHERRAPRQVRNWMLFGWAALGLAVLSKGLIGLVLPAGAIVFYTLWQRDWALWRHLHLGKGMLLLLLVTAPWFIAVSIANPEFPEFFFIHEHFDRYTSTVHRRDQPVWYFLPVLLIGLLPWLGSGCRALLRPGFKWIPEVTGCFDATRFLWSFVLFTLLFFSLGRSMLPPYILSVFPVLALIMGRQLATSPRVALDVGTFAIMGVLAIIAASGAHLFATEKLPVEYLQGYRYWILGAAAVMFLGAGVAGYCFNARGSRAIGALAVAALLSVQLLNWGYQVLGEPRTSRRLADAVRPYSEQGARVYAVNFYPQSLPFYLKQTVQLAMATSELNMGINQEPEKWISSLQEFLSRWQEEDQAVAVFRVKDMNRMDLKEMPMRIIYQDPPETGGGAAMNLLSFTLIMIGVLLNAAAQLALKASVRGLGAIDLDLTASGNAAFKLMSEPWLWVGLFCYGISVVVWILALSRVDVSIAYPMLSVGYVVNAVAAWALFGEVLSVARLSGIGIIIIGVYVLARS